MILSVGDKIIGTRSNNMGIIKEITKVRKKGYTWKYPDIDDRDFRSENSNDPLFEWGWELVREDTP